MGHVMQRVFKLLAVGLILFGISSAANAFFLTYRLDVSQNTWVLKAKTDAPGGIASFSVNLAGVASAVSDAPRGTFGGTAVNGFTLGNVFAANQAFAGQNTSNAASVVYGIGKNNVPDSAFGAPVPFTLVGSGILDADGYVTIYHGTNANQISARFNSDQPPVGAVFATVGTPTSVPSVVGPGSDLSIEYLVSFPAWFRADFDENFRVNGADFVIWQTHFPKATGSLHSEGDADNDDDVDGADLAIWQQYFPTTLSHAAGSGSAARARAAFCCACHRWAVRRWLD
jgi:hypothetical protein